jgi:hypothetical protein
MLNNQAKAGNFIISIFNKKIKGYIISKNSENYGYSYTIKWFDQNRTNSKHTAEYIEGSFYHILNSKIGEVLYADRNRRFLVI